MTRNQYFALGTGWRALLKDFGIQAEAADPMFALKIVETVSTESFDPPLFAALCSANLTQAVQRLARYKQLMAPMKPERRLEDEGENFRALVDGTREGLARHYLTQTRMSGGEIAFLLGFEDPNSFYRAFHDGTRQTPETVRDAMRLN